jgi:pyruvate dehydrogenase E1 component alpha subunit
MRMQGHAIHDGFEYVPRDLLTYWEERDPLRLYAEKLLCDGAASEEELAAIRNRCAEEIAAAIEYAESSPLPQADSVLLGVYAP